MPKDTTSIETTNADKVFDLPVKLQPGQVNTMSFSQDSISNMHLTAGKELVISFQDGSKVHIENFQELVNSAKSCGRDTMIQLSDNTIIYPEELNAKLSEGPVNFAQNGTHGDVVTLNAPPAGQSVEKLIQSGHEYKMGFNLDQTSGAAQAGQNLVITFKDGGVIVLKNYFTAMNGDLPPALTLADGAVIDANTLIASSKPGTSESVAEIVAADAAADAAGMRAANQEPAAGKEAEDVKKAEESAENVEPAAGEDVANVEPAAGTAGPLAGGRGGYGFTGAPGAVNFNGLNAVGAIGATALNYSAPDFRNGPIDFGNDGDATPVDDNPFMLAGDIAAIDESAAHSVNGQIVFNFGADGPSRTVPPVQTNGSFGFAGTTALTSGGAVITVTQTGNNTYMGSTPNGQTVFTLVVNGDGTYTFTQNAGIDHPDATNPDDAVNLQFGVVGTDRDGDSTNATITIIVSDDGPDAVDDVVSVGSAPLSVDGNVLDNDDAGFDGAPSVTSVSFNGTTIPVTGATTIVGNYGTLVISADGSYTYTSSNTALGTDQFGYTMRDFDGDTASANLIVSVTDLDTVPVLGDSSASVDETNLAGATVTGNLSSDFRADGPGTIAGSDNFSSDGSRLGNNLSSNGNPVTVAYDNGVYTGSANGQTVFTLTIANDGSYSFTLLQPLDHANASDPDDVINLHFGVVATDTDGDTANGTINIAVRDDGPVANDDSAQIIDGQKSVSGNVVDNDSSGADGFRADNIVTEVTFNGETKTIPVSGSVEFVSANGKLVIDANGQYTYTATTVTGGTDKFTYVIQDRDGDTDTAAATGTLTVTVDDVDFTPTITNSVKTVDETDGLSLVVNGSVVADYQGDVAGSVTGNGKFSLSQPQYSASPGLTSGGIPVNVAQEGNVYVGKAGNTVVFTLTINADGTYQYVQVKPLDHADKTNPDDTIELNFGVIATDGDGDISAPGSIKIIVKDDGPVAHNDVNIYDTHNGGTDGNVITGVNGGPNAADTLSNDNGNHVTKISFGGTSVDVPANGQTVSIEGKYGTLNIESDGSYTYDLKDNWQTLTNHQFTEDKTFPPLVEKKYVHSDSPFLGVDPKALDVSYDTTAKITFVSEGAQLNNTLGAYTVGADGTIQSVQLIVANVNDSTPGVSSTVNISATAGQQSLGFFIIADGATLNGGYSNLDLVNGTLSFVYGNGTAGERAAKVTDSGKDVSLVYTLNGVETVLNGTTYHTTERGASTDINADDTIRVVSGLATPGDHGTLRIGFEDLPGLGDHDYNDVVFDIQIAASCPADHFTYTLTDGDGDTSTATLDLLCNGNPDTFPTIGTATSSIDETGMNPSSSVTGQIAANYFNDGPGKTTINGGFTSDGSQAGGKLTSGGVEVKVTSDGNVYTGKAGNVTVFTLTLQTNGTYTFVLNKPLDHANTSNPDDVINLHFGVTGTDGDGDTATGLINIDVRDDGPVAVDDTASIAENATTATGNVLLNDNFGSDGKAAQPLTKIIFNGKSYDVPAQNSITVEGQFGKLTINANGDYSYVSKGTNGGGVDTFQYVIKDGDGDTSAANANGKLTVTVNDTDYVPTVTSSAQTVDETNLGPVTVNGAVKANYFNDGPGAVSGNGDFNSSGSLLGGKLTSNGSPVTVELKDGVYTGTAKGETVFTLKIESDGAYSFTLNKALDHKDASNPNDTILLKFGVNATDADGDIGKSTITITVKDDAPIANDDINSYSGGKAGDEITGNVITGVNGGPNAVDTLSKDGQNVVSVVDKNGTAHKVPAVGTVSVQAEHGILTISADGSYVYKITEVGKNPTITDSFTYTLKDGDGDTDTAILTLSGSDCKCDCLDVNLVVNNHVDNVVIKEDSSTSIHVVANAQGAGNQVLTVTMSNIDPTWGFKAPAGGTYDAAKGTWTIELPKGQNFDGSFFFKPPADSDADLSNIKVTATASEKGKTETAADQFNIIVDAVVDQPTLTVKNLGNQSWHKDYAHTIPLVIAAATGDKDGSEVITKIVIHLDQPFTNSVGNLTTLDSMGVSLNKGVEVKPGIWEITVNSNDATAALAGLTLNVPAGHMDFWPIHQSQISGGHSLQIPVEAYVNEANLSGQEVDYTDNSVVVSQNIGLNFYVTPLVLDLNGNGVDIVSQEHGVVFDMNNDGVADHTSWVAPTDGLLAFDANRDGLINNQSELFGSSGEFKDGFAKLASHDLNGDGVIDMGDDIFDSLIVWQDLNQDGISQANEMHKLADFGIVGIRVNATETSYDVADGYVSHESAFIYKNGHEGKIADVWFSVNSGANDAGLPKPEVSNWPQPFTEVQGLKDQPIIITEKDGVITCGGGGVLQADDDTQNAINNFIYKTASADKVSTVVEFAAPGGENAHAAPVAPSMAEDLHQVQSQVA